MLIKNKNVSMSLFLMLVIDTILMLGLITTGPQIANSVLFLSYTQKPYSS